MIFPLGAITNRGRLSSISLPDLHHSKVCKKKKSKENQTEFSSKFSVLVVINSYILSHTVYKCSKECR